MSNIKTRKDAPSQREALRGWSKTLADEYGSPNKMGAYEIARKEWGQSVAKWLWSRDEVLAEQVEFFGADTDEVDDINRRYGAQERSLKKKLLQ